LYVVGKYFVKICMGSRHLETNFTEKCKGIYHCCMVGVVENNAFLLLGLSVRKFCFTNRKILQNYLHELLKSILGVKCLWFRRSFSRSHLLLKSIVFILSKPVNFPTKFKLIAPASAMKYLFSIERTNKFCESCLNLLGTSLDRCTVCTD
jgi:hypothetical protein